MFQNKSVHLRDVYFLKNYLFRSYICVHFQLVAFVREHMWHKTIWLGHLMKLDLTHVGLLVECFFSCFVSVYIEVTVLREISFPRPLFLFLRVSLVVSLAEYITPISLWYLICYKVFRCFSNIKDLDSQLDSCN